VQHPSHEPQRIGRADLYRALGELDLARAELEVIREFAPEDRRMMDALERMERAESR